MVRANILSRRYPKWVLAVRRILGNPYLIFVLRLLLGGIFILAAVGKLPERAKFVDVVSGFGLLPHSWAIAYGSILPWLELIVGVALLLGFFSRYMAGVSLLMIFTFLVANGTAVYRAEPYECGCFGNLFQGLIVLRAGDALVADIVIIFMSVLIMLDRREFLSLDRLLWHKKRRLHTAYP